MAVVEDAPKVRESLRILLSESSGFECVTCASSAEDALKKIPRERLDVVLMDVNLPNLNGIDCVRELRARGCEVPVLMLTVCDDEEMIFPALEAGACGYLLKATPPEEILTAIEEVHAGGAPMSSVIARKVVQSFHRSPAPGPPNAQLSARELEVLNLLTQGFQNKDIGKSLGISEHTVAAHTRRIYDRLHVHSRNDAVAKIKAASARK